MRKVFVSSVSQGLEGTREQLVHDLRKAQFAVAAMEDFGAQPTAPIDVCLREVRNADIVILLVGPRYGSVLPQGLSYTQAEFREARGLNIPILAFNIPSHEGMDAVEAAALSSFRIEVGAANTYDSLAPDESLDRLSPKVLAALLGAIARGELTTRHSLFQTWEQFFAAQLGPSKSFFSHTGPFVAREHELAQVLAFVSGQDSLLYLRAPGGSGKSRLLLEAAKSSAGLPNGPQLRFVDSGAQWSPADVNELPASPTVLFFDDAHRRPDLDRLIAACRLQNPNVRCVVACRPSAFQVVRPLLSPILGGPEPATIELPTLSLADATTLARECLGPETAHLADRLVRLADGNPLVISVGGRCVAVKRVSPDILERSQEAFRAEVLDRLLDDPGLTSHDHESRRRLLEIVATVGPVVTDGDLFVEPLIPLVGGLPSYELRRMLAGLERSGFLARRGRLVRVNPDVLGDHLLYRAAVDDNGKPTGFVDAMIKAFPLLLENIVANAAELDWRAATRDGQDAVLATTWRNIRSLLPQLTLRQRADLLGQLKRAALFAPKEVLGITDEMAAHPEAPVDEQLVQWEIPENPQKVVDSLVDMFGFIAGHQDYTRHCVERLWDFAAVDRRPTEAHADHPRQKLGELLKYRSASQWHLAQGVQTRAIEALRALLQDPQRTEDSPWAISVLGSALDRLAEANEATRRQLTIKQFSLTPFLAVIADRRSSTMECIKSVALGPRPAEAGAAVKELAELLKRPWGPFGQELDPEDLAKWQPETEHAIADLRDIASAARSDVIRFIARRELRTAPRERWPQTNKAVDEALSLCPPIDNEDFYDVLAGVPWTENFEDLSAREERVHDRCKKAAQAAWMRYKTPKAVIETLLAGKVALQQIGWQGDSGRLTSELVAASPQLAEELLGELSAAGPPGWSLVSSALLALHRLNPVVAERMVTEFSVEQAETLKIAALDAVQWMVGRAGESHGLIAVIKRLAHDPSPKVRAAVPQVLRRLRSTNPIDAVAILAAIEWESDPALASAVLETLHSEYGIDPNTLTDDDVESLLRRIEGLRSIETYPILEFIGFAAKKRPRATVEVLLRRIQSVDARIGRRRDNSWTPIPYNGHGLQLTGLADSPEYSELLRLIRDSVLEASSLVQFWLPELFHAAVRDLAEGITVLREWVDSGESTRIAGAAHLLRGFHHDIVFSQHEFVADLLDAARRAGERCFQDAQSELHSVAVSGTYSGVPGEPMPRHVSARNKGQELVEHYATREAARVFYCAVVSDAESSIKRHQVEWDEEGDE